MIRFVKRAALGLLVAMGVQSPAMPSDWGADLPEARLSWNLGFGGGASIRGGYGLGLAYRVEGLEEPAPVFAFDVADRIARARVAGVPVFERTYRQGAAEDFPEEVIEEEALEAGSESSSPDWGWWAAGAAVALAVAASVSGSGEAGEDGDFENPGTTGVTSNDDGTWVGCVNGTCAVCPDGDVAEPCGDAYVAPTRGGSARDDLEWQRRLDAGTGGMGDLLPIRR